MKVDRRSFLGLGLGAAAGVALSPAGMKLTDDSSIWTQNWPWTPVPEDGEIRFEPSVCGLCPGSCGISVRKIDNRPVKIEGQEGYPVNNGGICLHGVSGLQYLYDPSRIKSPLKKNGDTFEPVSWEEAISIVSQKLAGIRNSGAADKLACVSGDEHSSIPRLFKRFLTAFGSPNFYTMPNLENALELTAETMHGKKETIAYDLENAGMILSFGAGLIEGWGSPVRCINAYTSRKDRSARLVQIEPRLSSTAAAADQWIPIKPGTEADLAFGICSVILKKQMHNPEYAHFFNSSFNKFAAMVQDRYSVENVAVTTGISAITIEEIATLFARFKTTAVAICGRGKGDHAQSLKEFTAVHALNCLVGNINKKGGAWVLPVTDYLEFPEETLDSIAEKGSDASKIANSVTEFFSNITATTAPGIEALFVYNSNPCYALNDAAYVREVIKKIPFVVSFTSFMDETAKQADIIFPCSIYLETTQDVFSLAGSSKQVVGLSRPVVDPVFDTRNPGDIVIELGKSLEGSVADNFQWDDYDSYLEETASQIWKKLSKNGYVVVSENAPSEMPSVDFAFLASADPGPVQLPGDNANYPLMLVPIDHMGLISNVPASSPFAVKTIPDTVIKEKDGFVEMNPETAGKFKLNQGDRIQVTTPKGSAVVRVHLFDGIMPGYIGMVKGLGHTAGNQYISLKGINVNELIAPVIEAGSGLDAAYGTLAKVSKA